jgi:hypothetical protein
MNRRQFHKTLAVSTQTLSWLSAQEATLVEADVIVNLSLGTESFIQDILATKEGVLVTVHDQANKSTLLGRLSPKGELALVKRLPSDASYGTMGIRSAGRLVVPVMRKGLGSEAREFDDQGNQVRTVPLPQVTDVAGYGVAGDTFVVVRGSGAIHLIDLLSGTTRLFEGVVPNPGALRLFSMSARSLLVVDCSKAQFTIVNTLDGTTQQIVPRNPALDTSRAFFAERAKSRPVGSVDTGAPHLILPSSPGADGSIFAIVYPIKRDLGVPVVRITLDGQVRNAMKLRLPDERSTPGLPSFIARVDAKLFAIYRKGFVAVYAASA